MSFLDALTPLARKRRKDIYEAFHNPDGTLKKDVEQTQENLNDTSFIKKVKAALGL